MPIVCTIQAVVAVSLMASLLLLVAAIAFGLSNRRQHVSVTDTPSCCRRETEWLFYTVNFSVNPCRFLFDYVCGEYLKKREQRAWGNIFYSYQAEFYRAPSQGAGIAVYRLFQSCLSAVNNAEKLGSSTAASYIGALLPHTTMTRTKRELLLFMLKTAVTHGIRTHPVVALYGRGGFTRGEYSPNDYLAVLLIKSPAPRIQAGLSDRYHRLRRDCLATVNRMMNLTVTLKNMEDLERDLNVPFGNYVLTNFSDVVKLAPGVTLEDWSWAVRNFSGLEPPPALYHSRVDGLRKTFSVLLDASQRAVTLVFLIFKAVANLLFDMLENCPGSKPEQCFRYCQRNIMEHSPLVLISSLKTYSAEHDAAFHRIFQGILADIAVETATIMPQTDHTKLLSYHNNFRLLLPKDVLPSDKNIPNMTSDFVGNLLALFRSGWSSRKYDLLPGITKEEYNAADWNRISVLKDTVVIPVDAYTISTFNASDDLVAPYAIIGIQMADAIWWDLLSKNTWSTATSELFSNYTTCHKSVWKPLMKFSSYFHVPLLSIETARRAATSSLWHSQFESFGGWRVSRCRLFHMLMVYHYYCPAHHIDDIKRHRKEAQYIASLSDDFRVAFQCQAPLNGTPTCRLEKENETTLIKASS